MTKLDKWLGIRCLFQTFDDLDSVKDVQTDILAVGNLLDEDEKADGEEQVCSSENLRLMLPTS